MTEIEKSIKKWKKKEQKAVEMDAERFHIVILLNSDIQHNILSTQDIIGGKVSSSTSKI